MHEPALAHLSAVDRSFVLAMCQDAGPSKMADIAARMSVSRSYASQYRLRLIAAELIEPAGHGQVRFAPPSLRDWLLEHTADV